MKKLKLISVLIICIFVVSSVFWVNSWKSQPAITQPLISKASQPTPLSQSNEQFSGDASIKLTEKTNKINNGNTLYSFKVTNILTNTTQTIFTDTTDRSISYSIPGNTWSPDNKQFFLTKTTPMGQTFLVFKADNLNYANGQKFLDIADYWSKTKYSLKIVTATGWASNDLIILTTIQENGSVGPLFWFVVSSHSFLQLSR